MNIRPSELHQAKASKDDKNKAKDKAVTIAWPARKLPCLTVWKAEHHVDDGYAAGLEPGTAFPLPRPAERAAGRVGVLKPGAAQTQALRFTLHEGKAAVAGAVKRVTGIAGKRKTTVQDAPVLS